MQLSEDIVLTCSNKHHVSTLVLGAQSSRHFTFRITLPQLSTYIAVMARLGFLGLGFLVFFNLTQTKKSPRVWVFSALVTQVRQTQKNSKKYKIFPSLFQA